MDPVTLHPTRCAICGTEGRCTEVYPARLPAGAFSPERFSARRAPDRIHHRIVRCSECGLLRADPAADADAVAALYARSRFDYGAEVPNLQRTYGRYLQRVVDRGIESGRLLEIGCGNGFFLQEARRRGFEVQGVEPSAAAVAAADPEIRDCIRTDTLRPGLLPADAFSVVCMFQLLDHLHGPGEAVDECVRVLRPGGALLCVTHDVDAWSARLLRARSPIVDVEHTYLFSRDTLRRFLALHGLEVVETGPAANRYSLSYLAHLLPLPKGLRGAVQAVLRATRLARVPLWVRLGNVYAVALKPAD